MGPDMHSIKVSSMPLSSSILVCRPCCFHLCISINLVILKIPICTSSTHLIHHPSTFFSSFSLYTYCQPAPLLFHLTSFGLWELGMHWGHVLQKDIRSLSAWQVFNTCHLFLMPKTQTPRHAASEGVVSGPYDHYQNGYFYQRLIKSQQHNTVNLTTIEHSTIPFTLHSFAYYAIL